MYKVARRAIRVCDLADPADDGLARIRRLGFTAVWVTPPFVQRTVQGDSAAYHGYWFTAADGGPSVNVPAFSARSVQAVTRLKPRMSTACSRR